jgi:hypothetical protein
MLTDLNMAITNILSVSLMTVSPWALAVDTFYFTTSSVSVTVTLSFSAPVVSVMMRLLAWLARHFRFW